MKTTTSLLTLLLVAVSQANVLQKRACDANNCARAVTGTNPGKLPVESRRADCASFLLTTVTPDTTTVTVTDPAPTTYTETVTTTGRWVYPRAANADQQQQRDIAPRAPVTVTPSAIPAYASPCSGASAYRSACSCWGLTGSVTTAPTPTYTATVTLSPSTVTDTASAEPTRCAGAPLKGCHSRPACLTGSNTDSCDCGVDTEGTGFCYRSPTAAFCSSYISCASSGDCPSGQRCLAAGNTCCPGAICQPLAGEGECPNSAAVARRVLAGEIEQRAAGMSKRDGKEHIDPVTE